MPTRIEVIDRNDTPIGAGTTEWWVRGAVELRPRLTVTERQAMEILPALAASSPTVWLSTDSVLSKLRKLKKERALATATCSPWHQSEAALHAATLLDLARALKRAGHRLFRFRVPGERYQPWRIEDMDGRTIGAIAPCWGRAESTFTLPTLDADGDVR